jgi:secondary thiamine-phosphate synthase enzyme
LIRTEKILVRTKGENDIVNVTDIVQDKLAKSKARDGFMILFLQSTTSALTIIEFEDGLRIDIPRAMSRIVPKSIEYEHERAYHDGNGHSHVKSSMIGVDLVLPFKDGELLLGTWQQIAVLEFDVRPRDRSLIVQIITE